MVGIEGVQLPSGYYAVNAIYTNQELPEYQDNPLIEALPPILSEEQAYDALECMPIYNTKERLLESRIRMHCVQRIFQVFQPLDKHFDLEQRFSMAIRQGYISRNPVKPDFAKRLQEGYKMIKQGKFNSDYYSKVRNTTSGFTIIGISGIGKSTAIKKILSGYQQIIVHSNYKETPLNLYQLTWLTLDCPHDGSTRALCTNFFMAVDRILGTSYFKKHGSKRNFAANTMLPILGQIAQDHCLGVLIIDEIQHLSRAKSGGAEEMLNFFVTLVNTIGVPVVLVGTNKAMPILQGEFRQARRGSGQGDMVWERMQNDEMWKILIESLWEFQWTIKAVPLTTDLINVLYEESQGITDIAVKLYAISQFRAIALGKKEEITTTLIKKVAEDSLKLVRPMLIALKKDDHQEIAKYGDIEPIDVNSFFNKYLKRLTEKSENEDLKNMRDNSQRREPSIMIFNQVFNKLLELDIDPDVAKIAVEHAISSSNGNHGATWLLKEAYKIAINVDIKLPNKSKNIKKGSPTYEPDDLRFIAEQAKVNKQSVYEALMESGYIKDPLKDFSLR